MNELREHRRQFLTTVGAVGAASLMASGIRRPAVSAGAEVEQLAIHGGTPVRATPLGYRPYGPQFYGGYFCLTLLKAEFWSETFFRSD